MSPHNNPYSVAAPLSTCTVEKQRSFIHFLLSEGVKPSEIYRRMKVQPNHTVTPTHIEPEQYTHTQSQAPEDECTNIQNMLSKK
jgi:hypothetical protein